jgi:hypothetical protein
MLLKHAHKSAHITVCGAEGRTCRSATDASPCSNTGFASKKGKGTIGTARQSKSSLLSITRIFLISFSLSLKQEEAAWTETAPADVASPRLWLACVRMSALDQLFLNQYIIYRPPNIINTVKHNNLTLIKHTYKSNTWRNRASSADIELKDTVFSRESSCASFLAISEMELITGGSSTMRIFAELQATSDPTASVVKWSAVSSRNAESKEEIHGFTSGCAWCGDSATGPNSPGTAAPGLDGGCFCSVESRVVVLVNVKCALRELALELTLSRPLALSYDLEQMLSRLLTLSSAFQISKSSA